MSAIPPHSGRPLPKAPPLSDGKKQNQPEFEPETQPPNEDGVMDDMATLAINPRLLEGLQAAETHRAAGDFVQMDDATIMLELRAGNMAGFDYLIQK
jgi:RNA polymerase sigma-70 factor, ECF subfamily